MKAAVHTSYGPPSVLRIEEQPAPVPGDDEILVKVAASAVTAADWRFRASSFPGGLWIIGRLMAGLFKPRRPVLGMDFSGQVVATGQNVAGFPVGQDVFGANPAFGAHAEFMTIKANGAVIAKPASLSHEDAASLPFAGLTSLVFLRDFAKVKPGQHLLIAGSTGNVGSLAIQIAKQLGARVTALASAERSQLALSLGADDVIDYRKTKPAAITGPFDAVFDTAGILTYPSIRHALAKDGHFIPLEFGLQTLIQALWLKLTSSHRILLRTSGESAPDLEVLAGMVTEGKLRPVVDSIHSLGDIAAAHARAQSRHKAGAVVVRIAG